MTIVSLGTTNCLLGNLSCIAVEISSALILELEYHWEVPIIGFSIAASSFIAGLASMAIGYVVDQRIFQPNSVVIVSVVVALLGSALIFDYGVSYQILIGDVLVYPCMTSILSISVGNMFLVADTSKVYTIENLNCLYMCINACCKVVSATGARSIISLLGRTQYAGMQVYLIAVGGAVAYVQLGKVQILEECSPSLKTFEN